MKNNLIRGIRKASRLPDGAAADGRLQEGRRWPTCRSGCPAVVIGGGLTAIDTATELLAYYPVQVGEDAGALRGPRRRDGEAGRCARCSTPEEREILDRLLEHGARRPRRARARGRAPASARLRAPAAGPGAASRSSTASASTTRRRIASTTRRSSRRSKRASRFIENLEPEEAVPDEYGELRAVPSFLAAAARARSSSCRRGRVMRRRGHDAQHHLREGAPGTVPARREAAVLRAAHAPSADGAAADARAGAAEDDDGVLHRSTRDGQFVTFFGDNHPDYAGNVVKAMASRQGRLPRDRALVPDELRALGPASARRASWDALSADGSRTSCTPRVVARRAPDADDRRSRRPGARGRAELPARPVLPAAELRGDTRRAIDGIAAADGGHRADRRLGRPRATACSR